MDDFAKMADAMADAVLDAVDKPLSKFHERLKSMEAKLAELEARPVPKYVGVWKAGEPYPEASLATHAGALWYANEATGERPGTPNSNWTLAVKSGTFNGKERAP